MKKSAPGIDGITYANWRWVDPQGLILAAIFNMCRQNTCVLLAWKHATVTLIHKGGDTETISNWRPICLQLTLYSAMLAHRIASWSIESSSFSTSQMGFLTFDGCVEHNFLLQALLTDSRRSKEDLMFAWLDLRDAFGSVPHELLTLMMERLGLSGKIVDVVRDIYKGSTIAVRTGRSSYTAPIPQNRGVKQGCPLSPILFNVALEGLLHHLSASDVGYRLAGDSINSLAYADDVCIAAPSKAGLQHLLNRCSDFTEWAHLTFNTRKCPSLCMVNSVSPIFVDPLFTPQL